MARHKLTDSKVKAITKVGVHGDGDGLYLRVQASGSRSWVFIWRRFGTRREIGLGPYGSGSGHVSLASARVKAQEARDIVGRGGDPKIELSERQSAIKQMTFGQIADEFVDTMKPKWKSHKSLQRWERFTKTYAKPIRKVPIEKISTDDILRVLKPLWHEKPESSAKFREALKLVLDHAKARNLRAGENPAEWKGNLEALLPPPKRLVRGHHAAMRYQDIAAFLQRLSAVNGVSAMALEFTILTAVRSGEARGVRWDEIDLDSKLWTIPAARMKAGREHRIPLSDRAVGILNTMQKLSVNEFVFPGSRGLKPLSDMSLAKALKSAGGEGFTVHGFRSAFRDWVGNETSFPREIAEAALAHEIGNAVERAYRRGDALEKRRYLMDAWASYLGGFNADVISLERRA
ncbi:integrase arm-type DNA-binding domain-containing protein [Pseudochrobactrum algeriensis]|nr:site-specific integrase [Pseudochrobactrum algeriensis]QVQ38421.1 integrase arm-type DNA-binding domain-containing protein [Pseudochrobactrum algeriensis]QVQ41637.1 integrase arm-type DNA-binding domain-containing protein [Pseudochrobactrum algeriensis]QVQ45565.1 integrase arm-type DNA-binding domain-containing protein [Pseudochrobactrum algeriensis]